MNSSIVWSDKVHWIKIECSCRFEGEDRMVLFAAPHDECYLTGEEQESMTLKEQVSDYLNSFMASFPFRAGE